MKRLSKKGRIALCLSAVVLVCVLAVGAFIGRDIWLYYTSGLEYVMNNYDSQLEEIECDIQFEVTLNESSWNRQSTVVSMNGAKIYADLKGPIPFYYATDGVAILMQYPNAKILKNTQINFAFPLAGTPFSCKTLGLIDYESLLGEIRHDPLTTVESLSPNPKVVLDNIQVIVEGEVFAPICYSTNKAAYKQQANFTIGLFNDPQIYDRLISQGKTTATVKITKLYQRTYQAPPISKCFQERVMAKGKEYGSNAQFRGVSCGNSSSEFQGSWLEMSASFSMDNDQGKDLKIADVKPILSSYLDPNTPCDIQLDGELGITLVPAKYPNTWGRDKEKSFFLKAMVKMDQLSEEEKQHPYLYRIIGVNVTFDDGTTKELIPKKLEYLK